MTSKKQAIFTISDADYAPMALALFDGVRKFYKDSGFFLFILGTGNIDKIADDINVVYIGDVLSDLDLSQRLVHYLQVEISTSVRPECFQFLFAKGYERSLYIDPDVYVFRRMTEVDQLLDNGANGIVTPHALQSVDAKNAIGGDNVFLQCGIFNLGFLALQNTPETLRMLKWWATKLKWHCVVDWPNGYFVDQKWLEFLPVYFDGFQILKMPTYNYAPWNSEHHKLIAGPKDTFFLDDLDTPVSFIHFSGIKRAEAHFMHMREAYRFYVKKLAEIRFVKLDFVNYDVRFKDGLYLDKVCIFLYKDYVERTKDTKSNPLFDEGFRKYLRTTDPETGFPIYVRKLFEIMPDIFVGYLRSGIAPNFDSLIATMKSQFSYDAVASLETMSQLRDETIGQRFSIEGKSPIRSPFALAASPYERAVLSFTSPRKSEQSARTTSFKADRIEIIQGTVRICVPRISESGELLSAEDIASSNYTEIWVPSSRCKEQLSETYGLKNLTAIPYCVPRPQYEVRHTGLDGDKFTVILVHDFSRDFDIQNPLESIAAFARAFKGRKDVQLICYLINATSGDDLNRLKFAANNAYVVIAGSDDAAPYYSYLHHAHCFISLHEDITFGYLMAEAMRLGKFVVATKRGGNTDFMNEKNSFLVDSALEKGMVSEAARALRLIHGDVDVLNSRGKHARLHIQKHMSASMVGYVMHRRIDELSDAITNFQSRNIRPPLSVRVYHKLRRTFGPKLRRFTFLVKLHATLRAIRYVMRSQHLVTTPASNPQVAAVMNILLKKVSRPAVLE